LKADTFWQEFLKSAGFDSSTEYYECSYFANEEWADKLLQLVLEGRKIATTGCVLSYEAEDMPLPQVGNLSIVTNFAGVPGCVIETIAVTILPFSEVSWDMAKLEGEDEVMQTWIDGHRHFFELEGEEHGFTFTDSTPVFFEEFEVIYKA